METQSNAKRAENRINSSNIEERKSLGMKKLQGNNATQHHIKNQQHTNRQLP